MDIHPWPRMHRLAMVPLSRDEAYALMSLAADCRVTQVVDIRTGRR